MKANLPKYAFVQSHVSGETMMIVRGEKGFQFDKNVAKFTAEELNTIRGVKPEEVKAMEVGALFGWDVPGADPEYHKTEEKYPVSRKSKAVRLVVNS